MDGVSRTLRWCVPLLGALALLFALWTIGPRYGFHRMEFHSTELPLESVLRFNTLYSVLGGTAVLLLARSFALLGPERLASIVPRDRVLWVLSMIAAFVFPLLARKYVLYGMVLSDDERVYLYAAQLLASGQLQTTPHPMPAFFDHVFVINDGVRYTQYFLGWPFLLAPGVLLGAPWLMNPLYWALALPPVSMVARRVAGQGAARFAVLLHVFSPMWILFAAGYLSHVTASLFIAWTTWAAMRSRDSDAPPWIDGALALFFCAGFFVRPYTMLMGGLPSLVWWGLGVRKSPSRMLAFVAPAATLAGVFLALNLQMNGGIFKTGYGAYWDYLERVDFRNHGAWKGYRRTESFIPNLRFSDYPARLRVVSASLYRMSYDWMGWPFGFALALFAPFRGEGRLVLGILVAMVVALLGAADAGVDVIGPVHAAELSIPLGWATVAGWASLRGHLRSSDLARRWLVGLVPALLVVVVLGYLPYRWTSVRRVTNVLRQPFQAVERAKLDNAVLFYKRAFSRQCAAAHFVYGGPINPPGDAAPVIFALDRGPKKNRQLMKHYPDRRAYKLTRGERCRYGIVPID